MREMRGPRMTSRPLRLPAQISIIDIADRDRPAGDGAAEAAGELQRRAGGERGVDRLEMRQSANIKSSSLPLVIQT
jgi:hypothetical protein